MFVFCAQKVYGEVHLQADLLGLDDDGVWSTIIRGPTTYVCRTLNYPTTPLGTVVSTTIRRNEAFAPTFYQLHLDHLLLIVR